MARDRNVAIANFDLYQPCADLVRPRVRQAADYSYHLAGVSLRAANIVDNVTEDCALQQAS